MLRPMATRARDGAAALRRRGALVRRGADRGRRGEAATELKLAKQLIEQTAQRQVRAGDTIEDDVAKRMLELIQTKVEGQDITVAPTDGAEHKIIDLMEALKASLAAGERASPRSRRSNRSRKESCQVQARREETRRREVIRRHEGVLDARGGGPARHPRAARALPRALRRRRPALGAERPLEFSFQDIVLLRTAKGLEDANIKPRRS